MWVGIVHLQTAWLDQEGLPKTLLTGAGKSAAAAGGGGESSCKIEWVRMSKEDRNGGREVKKGRGRESERKKESEMEEEGEGWARERERVKFITAKYSKS